MKREFTQEQKEQFKANALQAKKEVAAMEADNMAMMMDPQQFKHFLEVSRLFTEYSDCNKWLIFIQCIQRGMLPQKVASYTTWKKLHHQVKKGEKAIKIYAPVTYGRFQSNETVPATAKDVEAMEEYDEQHKDVVKGYKVVSVFELKQTEGDPLNIVEVPTITWQQAIKEAKSLKLPKRYDEALQEAIKAMEEKAAAEANINKAEAIDVTEAKEETAPAVSSETSSYEDLQFTEDGSLIVLPFTNENGSFKLVSDVIYNENKTSNAMIKTIYNKLVKTCNIDMVENFFRWSATNPDCTSIRKHEINVILGTEEKQEVPKLKKSLVDVYENNGLKTVSGYTTTVDGVELAIYKKNRNDYVINELSSGLRIGGGYSSLTVVKELLSDGFNGTIKKVKDLLDNPTKQILEACEAMNQYKQTGRTLTA
jgi:hypothetical protein